MASEQGFSNQKKKGKAQFKTIHSTGSDSYGAVSVNKSLFDLTLVALDVDSATDVLGSDGQVKYWNLEILNHNCFVGAVIRIVNNDLINFEFEVIEVPDTDHVYVLPISPVKPEGYMCRPMAWVTQRSDGQGNPQISLTPAPVKFLLDGNTTDVSKDTVTPGNTIALPVEDYEARASLSAIEADTGTLAAVDFATESTLSSLEGKDFATESTLSSLEGKDFATESTLSSLEGKDFATQTTLSAIEAKLAGSLAPVAHDQVILAYVGATTDIASVTYKLAGTTVATLTLSYDGSNRLVGVVRS